ncbi:hypothetical protein, partial [Pseudomonas sp. 30_B]
MKIRINISSTPSRRSACVDTFISLRMYRSENAVDASGQLDPQRLDILAAQESAFGLQHSIQ